MREKQQAIEIKRTESKKTKEYIADCQISQWTPWSKCFGTCEIALSVRNR